MPNPYREVREALDKVECEKDDAGEVTLSVLGSLKRLLHGFARVRAVAERARRLKSLQPDFSGPAVSPYVFLMLKMSEQRLRGRKGHGEVYELLRQIEEGEEAA